MSEEAASFSADYSSQSFCLYQEKPLELETAIKILENADSHKTMQFPPVKPKGGEVYLFVARSKEEQG